MTKYIASKLKSDPIKLVGKTFQSLTSLKLFINDLNINLKKRWIFTIKAKKLKIFDVKIAQPEYYVE